MCPVGPIGNLSLVHRFFFYFTSLIFNFLITSANKKKSFFVIQVLPQPLFNCALTLTRFSATVPSPSSLYFLSFQLSTFSISMLYLSVISLFLSLYLHIFCISLSLCLPFTRSLTMTFSLLRFAIFQSICLLLSTFHTVCFLLTVYFSLLLFVSLPWFGTSFPNSVYSNSVQFSSVLCNNETFI